MSRRTRALLAAAMGVAVVVAGSVLTRHVIVVTAEEDAYQLRQAILDYVVERNPAAPLQAFRHYPEVLVAEARKTNIDHCLGLAQAEVESEFRPEAVGSAGEIGLYQILPRTAAFLEPVVGYFQRPVLARGKRDLGDLADPLVSTRFAMAYLRDIMTRRPSLREALTEYNGGPAGRHADYYQRVMGAYVEILERADLRCRFQPVPRRPLIALLAGI